MEVVSVFVPSQNRIYEISFRASCSLLELKLLLRKYLAQGVSGKAEEIEFDIFLQLLDGWTIPVGLQTNFLPNSKASSSLKDGAIVEVGVEAVRSGSQLIILEAKIPVGPRTSLGTLLSDTR